MKKTIKTKKLYALRLFCSMLVTIVFTVATAQTPVVVTGIVKDPQNNPISGVSVTVKGDPSGTSTDAKGFYSIHIANSNAFLIFSHVGMETQTLSANGKTSVMVLMESSNSSLNDVVVIGYGSIKKKNVVGAVSSMGETELKDRPINRIDQAMAGNLPGVQVQATTGTPGAPLTIRVRGAASISSSNDPIYIVDGVPVDDLNDIDPLTIQSIDVLKDAASTAIYGARGSNGVVLITTKKGKVGKPRITFSANYAYQTPEKYISVLNPQQWIQFRKDIIDSSWVNYGRTLGQPFSAADNQDSRAALLKMISPTVAVANTHTLANPTYMYDPYWALGTDSLNYVDWQHNFYDNKSLMQKYNLSASGGNENVTYSFSGEYMKQSGMVTNTGYERYTFRSNLEMKLSSAVKLGMNIAPSISWQTGPTIEGKNGAGYQPAGIVPITEKTVSPDSIGVGSTQQYRWSADVLSPNYAMRRILNKTQLVRLMTNVYLNANITKGLNLNVTGAWNSSNTDFKNYLPTDAVSSAIRRTALPGALSTAARQTANAQYYLFQSLLTYEKSFGNHNFSLLAGISSEQNNANAVTQRNTKFPNDNLYTFDFATSTVTASNNTESQRTVASVFGRILYNYKSRYLFSGSLRRDGSSRFGENYKYGNFPAASVAWRISDEKFMNFSKGILNDLKIRYSWGIAGNDRIGTNDYPSIPQVNPTSYSFANAQYVGYSVTTISSPNLRWEKTTSNNIGLDATLIKNRVTLTVDVYSKITRDLLLSAPVPLVTGFATENTNVGSVQNTGVEFNITSLNVTKKDFNWSTRANLSFNKNRVLSLTNNNTPLTLGFGSTVQIAVGQPIYEYKVYKAIGVYTTPDMLTKTPKMTSTIIGDPVYQDANGDGKIDVNDITNAGSPTPTYFWGITNSFTYKRFDLSFLLQGSGGNTIFSLFGRNIDRPAGTSIGSYDVKSVWATRFRSVDQPGDGITPRVDASTAGLYDSRWIYDGAFWKIKNITVGYNFKTNLIPGVSSMRIYLSADNVWMHDHYTGGYSPEAFQSDANLSDWSSYPTSRSISAGLNIGL